MAAALRVFGRSGSLSFRGSVSSFHTSRISCAKRKKKQLYVTHQIHEFKEWPDYTFLDGRPTPIGSNQLKRLKEQRDLVGKAVQMLGELDYAVKRFKNNEEMKEQEKQEKLKNKLKPKGKNLVETQHPLQQ